MEDLPTKRYKLLFSQVREELKDAYGWKAKAAEVLGVSPSYVAKIASGRAGEIGHKIIDRAIASLGLPREWFYDPDYETKDFRRSIDRHRNERAIDFYSNKAAEQDRIALRQRALQLQQRRYGDGPPVTAEEVKILAAEFLRRQRSYYMAHLVIVGTEEEALELAADLLFEVRQQTESTK